MLLKTISISRIITTLFLLISSVIFILQYSHFIAFTKEILGKYYPVKWILAGHITGGATALLTGPFQFISSLRNRYMRLHRVLGAVYLVAIMVRALSALYLTFTTTMVIGFMYTNSLHALIFVWLVSSLMAYIVVKQKKIKEHEAWMVRSYICTFAFIVQNYLLKIPFIVNQASFNEIAPGIIWFSWSIPLFIYQVYLSERAIKPVRLNNKQG